MAEGQGRTPAVKEAAEHEVREREARAKEDPPDPSTQTDDGSITVVPADQHFRSNGSASRQGDDRYAREDVDALLAQAQPWHEAFGAS
ncbi:MAG: hypothetical protein ACRDOK_09360 [Streptosporangiaceae bacterium]